MEDLEKMRALLHVEIPNFHLHFTGAASLQLGVFVNLDSSTILTWIWTGAWAYKPCVAYRITELEGTTKKKE
ncbi:hypothetical protein EVAR_6335_1 [Eumeta japonica]|uniref:Uncharacterized protein n=1 Tax=Eumeta variegata TaxID=151549 RepID=A0A4C1TBV4_EUMVA|nr:hypothetical protein EVAR_6335_1 [Eumeta japonica]